MTLDVQRELCRSVSGTAPALRGGASVTRWALPIACLLSSTALAQAPPAAGPDVAQPSAPAATTAPEAPVAAPPPPPQTAVSVPEPAADTAQPSPSATATATAPPVATATPIAVTPAASDDEAESGAEAIPGDPWGDGNGGISSGAVSFRVLLQTRYTQAFPRTSDNTRPGYALREGLLAREGDGWNLNRFFLRVGADPIEQLGFRAIIDFAELANGNPDNAIKQAYATLRPLPKHLEFHTGVFKLPFSIMELDPIASYELASLGPTDDLVKGLGFGGRDIGADVMLAPLQKSKLLRVYVGAFRGHSHDEHASPLGAVGARVESKPLKGLRVGADVVGHPYSPTYLRPFDTSSKDVLPMPDDPLFPRAKHWASGVAYSADVTFERWRWMLRGEGVVGTRVDVDTRYGARSFWAAWGVVAYRFQVGPVRLMPALRAEWLDADRQHGVGARRVLDAGVTCFFTKQIRLLLDAMRSDVEPGTPIVDQPRPLAGFPYFELDSTKVVAQLQVEI